METIHERTNTPQVRASTSVYGDFPTKRAQGDDPITSDQTRDVMDVIFFVAINGAVSVTGSAANIINIVIFLKQGYNDSITIKFIGLAISDLGALVALMWQSICFNPLFRYSSIGFDSVVVQYITAGMSRGWFVLVTSWITAFITFERCVCIAMPLRVRSIITPKQTLIAVVAIFMVMFASVAPVFCSANFAPLYYPQRNRTLVGVRYSSNAAALQDVSFSITVVEQLSSFIFVIVCTLTLIHHLLAKSQWRQKATAISSSGPLVSVSGRDKKVVRMVAFISSTFIACYLPSAINLIFMIHFSSDYSSHGRYQNSFHVSWAVVNTLEAINSSINIVVYYNMSSKFKTSFNELFGTGTKTIQTIIKKPS